MGIGCLTVVEITIWIYIELPFWIPLESGVYHLSEKTEIDIRNDIWEVAIANPVDGPFDLPPVIFVNEERVQNNTFLTQITRGHAPYFHKRKMKTTFILAWEFTPIPKEGIPAKPGTAEWVTILEKVMIATIQFYNYYDYMLEIVNQFIDRYVSVIGPSGKAAEVRSVSEYDTSVWFLMKFVEDDVNIRHTTKLVLDTEQLTQPFPLYRVASSFMLKELKEEIQKMPDPKFHYLEWARVLNCNREKRYQDALVSAVIVLEALGYLYLRKQGFGKKQARREIRRRDLQPAGLAGWVERLTLQTRKDRSNVAKLIRLRNRVVHDQKPIGGEEVRIIVDGIESLKKLREQFLLILDSSHLHHEQRFSSLLEPVLMEAQDQSIMRLVPVSTRLRFEKDQYALTRKDFPSGDNGSR